MMTLPVPTKDQGRLKADLEEHGYCLVKEALDAQPLAAVNQRLVAQARAERQLDIDFKNPGHLDNQWVNMLMNKGVEFQQLVVHPKVSALIAQVLGDYYLLSCCDAQIKHPGSDFMPLHTDQWWMPQPAPSHTRHTRVASIRRGDGNALSIKPVCEYIAPPAAANVMWMISDFTVDNGATVVVPGSHRSGRQPDQSVPHQINTVAGTGRAGTALVFDGRLWHAAGRNSTQASRYGITCTFCGPQFRQLENYTRGLRTDVLKHAPAQLLERLGFQAWSTYGHTGDPDRTISQDATTTLGVLHP